MSITIKDFQPINHWSLDRNGDLSDSGEPLDLIDETTERKYRNESTQIIRFKCALLAITVPIVHAAAACLSIAWKIMKLVTFSYFWIPTRRESKYNLKERARLAGQDLGRMIAFPLAILGLELSTLYGLLCPHDGRKVYATIERAMYGRSVIAPCFQPHMAVDDE